MLGLNASTCKALIFHLLRGEILKQAWGGHSVPHHHSAPAVHLSRASVPVVRVQMPMPMPSQAGPPSLCQPQFQNCGGDATAVISPPPSSPTHTPCPRTACRMIARVREIRRLSDASRLGSLKNKSSCAGLRRPLSFRRYPFPSHASSAKVLYVSPPLGPCAALVGAGVLNKSQH